VGITEILKTAFVPILNYMLLFKAKNVLSNNRPNTVLIHLSRD